MTTRPRGRRARLASGLCAALCLATSLPASAQVNTAEARLLLREAVVEAYRSVDCVFYFGNDRMVEAFFKHMDNIAAAKFREAGLRFPSSIDARDAAFLPIFDDLYARGLLIEDEAAQTDSFPSACKES